MAGAYDIKMEEDRMKEVNGMKKASMLKKASLMLTLMMVLVLVASGCNFGATDKVEEIDIMLDWYPNAVHTYLYTALEKGYFEEEGVKVNIIFPTNPTDPINMAAAGKIDLGITYQPDVIMARAKDVPVVSVAAVVRSPLNHLVLLQESEIQSPKDLEGKKVGYPGIPVNEPLLKTMVETDGGDYSKVELVNVGFELGSSIVSKKVDAVVGAYINHEVPVLEHKGVHVKFMNPVNYGVPSFYELVIVTNKDNLKKKEKAIQAFWRGAQKGFEYTQANPKESLDILFKNQDEANFPLVREVEEKSLNILIPKMSIENEKFGSQTRDSWEETTRWLEQSGLIEKVPTVDDMYINIVE